MTALAVAGALFLLALPCLAGLALAQDIPEDLPLESGHDFISWLMEPMTVSMVVLIAVLFAGILIGAGFMYLEYHVFKISFERLGRVLLYAMPLAAVAAMGGTLALHKYNLFLLSLYLVIPLLGAPIAYVLYNRLLVEEYDRTKL